jgi:Flp pilus assembly pilin Flp
MRNLIWRWPQRTFRRGQALAEYSIIVAIVAIASIAVVTVFGRQIRELLFASAERLSGDEDATVDNKTSGEDGSVDTDINDW